VQGIHFSVYQRHIFPPPGQGAVVILTRHRWCLAARCRSQTNFCIVLLAPTGAYKMALGLPLLPLRGRTGRPKASAPLGSSAHCIRRQTFSLFCISLRSLTNFFFVFDARFARRQTLYLFVCLLARANKLKSMKAKSIKCKTIVSLVVAVECHILSSAMH
jgi:hypothetical protein